MAVVSDIQVGEPVVVIVAYRHAHAVVVAGVCQSRSRSHISERAVAVLLIQAVPIQRISAVEIGGEFYGIIDLSAVHQEDVEQTIVVVVQQRNSSTMVSIRYFWEVGELRWVNPSFCAAKTTVATQKPTNKSRIALRIAGAGRTGRAVDCCTDR